MADPKKSNHFPPGQEAPFIRFEKFISHLQTREILTNGVSLPLPVSPEELDDLIQDLIICQDAHPISTIFNMVSAMNEAITVWIIQSSMAQLETKNNMTPPCPFCWITMGSDARGEQVIRTDQDNALIYTDPVQGKNKYADLYFKALAELVVEGLDRFGFKRCKGDVMASNDVWRRPLGQWLSALDRWVGSSEPMAIRKLTILLDFRAVFGDKRLARILVTRVFDLFHAHGSVSHFLVRDDKLFASPKTLTGRIRTRRFKGHRACFNLKTHGLIHLINCIRLLAVNHRIQTPSTLGRMEQLRDEKIISCETHDQYLEAFVFLSRLKLYFGLGKNRVLPDNYIDISTLNPESRKSLTNALDTIILLQKRTDKAYNQAWMNFF